MIDVLKVLEMGSWDFLQGMFPSFFPPGSGSPVEEEVEGLLRGRGDGEQQETRPSKLNTALLTHALCSCRDCGSIHSLGQVWSQSLERR